MVGAVLRLELELRLEAGVGVSEMLLDVVVRAAIHAEAVHKSQLLQRGWGHADLSRFTIPGYILKIQDSRIEIRELRFKIQYSTMGGATQTFLM